MVFPLFVAVNRALLASVSDLPGLPKQNAKPTVRRLGSEALPTFDTVPSGDFSALQLEARACELRIERLRSRIVSTNASVRRGQATKLDLALFRAFGS
jgi:hypothetical protein